MNRFKNILVYVGHHAPPAPAIERATALALHHRARLTLVDVLPDAPPEPLRPVPAWADFGHGVGATRRQELNALAVAIRRQGVDVQTGLLFGNPAVEIIRQVHYRRYDLVLKTAQGPGGFLGGILGSTAKDLFRKCPCPVWVIKRDDLASSPISRGGVVAAVSPTPRGKPTANLDRDVLKLAASIARSRGLGLDVVHAWWWSEPMAQADLPGIATETAAEIVNETRKRASTEVERLLETVDLSGVECRVHVSQGRPLDIITVFSENAEVVVLGTRPRAGFAASLVGNTAERILHRLGGSVLAIKPRDFVSPVQLPAEDLERCA